MGLLIVLALSAISLADRESPSGQLGSGAAQSGSQAPPASLGAQSASLAPAGVPSTALPAGAKRRVTDAYAKLPLAFIPNAGQTDGSVRYYAQGAGYSFYFTDHKAVLALQKGRHGEALDLRFVGANPNAASADARPQYRSVHLRHDEVSGTVGLVQGRRHEPFGATDRRRLCAGRQCFRRGLSGLDPLRQPRRPPRRHERLKRQLRHDHVLGDERIRRSHRRRNSQRHFRFLASERGNSGGW